MAMSKSVSGGFFDADVIRSLPTLCFCWHCLRLRQNLELFSVLYAISDVGNGRQNLLLQSQQ